MMKKVIFLVDMNAFYISCEMVRNPALKGRPAAVAGDPKNRSGIILAANYEARKFGIKTTMVLHEAKKLCPDILFVPPDHTYYQKMSKMVMNLLNRYTPVIQINSIDEAWLDMTGCESLFGEPVEIAQKIMSNIQSELGLWCSIGISENKFLAKMASEVKKPLGITEIWVKDIAEKLWPMAIREMYGIGKQTEQKLHRLGIYKIGELAKFDKALLSKHFGKAGIEMHQHANGIDHSSVTIATDHDSKSISRSTTLSADTVDIKLIERVLLDLAEEIGTEARQNNLKGKTISIVLKYSDFQSVTRQKTVSATYLTKEIYLTGMALIKENWDGTRMIRLLGIGLSNFKEIEMEQLSFFDELGLEDKNEKEEKLERAMDRIREKFGVDKIKRAKSFE
ncbi:MAG: nucleotidyltransferase/DNA polymerase involved in repair [Clostridia bacterium]|jgi:DNA polymerase-4|nr:nucleotidyltransferase/DNA polymerase involved in repair [Clostridia bacterium]